MDRTGVLFLAGWSGKSSQPNHLRLKRDAVPQRNSKPFTVHMRRKRSRDVSDRVPQSSKARPLMQPDNTTVVWIRGRGDLRLADNPLMRAASGRDKPVLFLFLWSPILDVGYPWGWGAAGRVWLHHALASMNADLQARYSNRIVFCRLADDHSVDLIANVLLSVMKHVESRTLYFGRRYEPPLLELDRHIEARLREQGSMTIQTYNTHLLYEPWEC